MTPAEVSAAKGGEVFTFTYDDCDVAEIQEFGGGSWGLYLADTVAVGDTITPDADEDISLPGSITFSVTLFHLDSFSTARVQWEGSGFTVEYTLDGQTFVPLSEDGVVDLAGDPDFDIRISFPGGIENDLSSLDSLSVYILSSETITSSDGRTATFTGDAIHDGTIVLRGGELAVQTDTRDPSNPVNAVEFWAAMDEPSGAIIQSTGFTITMLNGSITSSTGCAIYVNGVKSPVSWAEVHRNLVPNPQVADVITGWTANYGTGGAGTVTRLATGGPTGGPFARATWTTASTAVGSGQIRADGRAVMAANYRIPVTPGQILSGAIFVRSSIAQRLVCQVTYFDATGAQTTISPTGHAGTAEVVVANTWTRLTISNKTVPANAAYVLIGPQAVTGTGSVVWPVGATLDATMAQLELSASVTAYYFDGATVDSPDVTTAGALSYEWLGTANQSQSRVLQASYTYVWAGYDPTQENHYVVTPITPTTAGFTVGVIDMTMSHLALYTDLTEAEIRAMYDAQTGVVFRVDDENGLTVTESTLAVDIYAYAWSIVTSGGQ